MHSRLDSIARLARINLDRLKRPPSVRTRMLFYESMPDLRKALIGAGLLKLRPPVTASPVTSSEVAIAERVQVAYRIAAAEAASRRKGTLGSVQWLDRKLLRRAGRSIRGRRSKPTRDDARGHVCGLRNDRLEYGEAKSDTYPIRAAATSTLTGGSTACARLLPT